ncbi:hypothetical protein THERMOT_1911 [Bathymodiolus thermophilus thioautotrophic gill symbiont]|nr:hypothetical protein THERMOT_1911 [Bathymodiolus thermophilus thioautotrophic gill symbiont]
MRTLPSNNINFIKENISSCFLLYLCLQTQAYIPKQNLGTRK